jgi:L-seryl-tRNA(Ser) seleniumtransferase
LQVGKEELVGLLRALDLFVEEDHEATRAEWRERADRIADALREVDALGTAIDDSAKSVTPTVVVSVDERVTSVTTTELVRALRGEKPRVFVGADALDDAQFTVNPMCLTDTEADYVVKRIRVNLSGEAKDSKTTGGRDERGP